MANFSILPIVNIVTIKCVRQSHVNYQMGTNQKLFWSGPLVH